MPDLFDHVREEIEIAQDATQKKVETFYQRLAEEGANGQIDPALHDQVKQEVVKLKEVSSYLRQEHLTVSAAADELDTRLHDITESNKKRPIIPHAPANAVIDYEEKKTNHFAQGMNFYKLALVCIIGSFAGVVVELLWCLIIKGYIESRNGLVFGPFNLLYGVGAVVMTVCLYKYRNRSALISFAGGMVTGSVVEYICSWGQQMVFGTRSWDYSNMPFNLNGRICLLYSVFWGFLGVLWIKSIYPRMAKGILRLPNKVGRVLTWAMIVFFIFDATITSMALFRWVERQDAKAVRNSWVDQQLDTHFSDTRMQQIFPNMTFAEKTIS